MKKRTMTATERYYLSRLRFLKMDGLLVGHEGAYGIPLNVAIKFIRMGLVTVVNDAVREFDELPAWITQPVERFVTINPRPETIESDN